MNRSMQEIVELLIFALIALLVGTGLVWVTGWVLELVGFVFQWLAALVWSLLRFVVPVAIVAVAVYALVKILQSRDRRGSDASAQADAGPTAPAADGTPGATAGGSGAVTSAPTSSTTSADATTPPEGPPPEAPGATTAPPASEHRPTAADDPLGPPRPHGPDTEQDVGDAGPERTGAADAQDEAVEAEPMEAEEDERTEPGPFVDERAADDPGAARQDEEDEDEDEPRRS